MKVLGFDTNKNFIAWALVNIENDKESIVEYDIIDDNELYFHNIVELIKKHDVIAVENFQYYQGRYINDDSIEAIKRIGHIQIVCKYLHKLLWEFKRPEILKSLFGSGRIKKPVANRLFSTRLGMDLKVIPQHCRDAAMVGVYANYFILHQQKYEENDS